MAQLKNKSAVISKREKMSKSRGNVILIDEVVKGVCDLASGFEFRDLNGQLVDWKIKGIWFQHDQGYRTSTKYGREPVFLHKEGFSIPVVLTTMKTLQHVQEFDFWRDLLGQLYI